MKRTSLLFLSMAMLSVQSCSTVFSGTTQSINIQALDSANNQPLEGCTCVVYDSSGGQYVVNGNPGVVSVKRGHDALQVTCKKEGYKQLNTAVGDSFNGTTLVNILFWPGFIVDAATGAMKKYPSHYSVSMEKIKPAH